MTHLTQRPYYESVLCCNHRTWAFDEVTYSPLVAYPLKKHEYSRGKSKVRNPRRMEIWATPAVQTNTWYTTDGDPT